MNILSFACGLLYFVVTICYVMIAAETCYHINEVIYGTVKWIPASDMN